MGKSNISEFLIMKPDGTIVGDCLCTGMRAADCNESLAKVRSIFGLGPAPLFDLEKMLALFKESVAKQDDISKTTADNYCTWLRNLNKVCDGKLILWILDALLASKDPKERIEIADKHFDDFASSYNPGNGGGSWNVSNTQSALRKFVKFFLSYFDGIISVSFYELELAKMIARTALFASREVVEKVKAGELGDNVNLKNGGNQYASWDCMGSRRKNSQPAVNGETLDGNTKANLAIKQAVLESLGIRGTQTAARALFNNYETCHIWESVYDTRYYMSIMNIVLIPRSLASLTDHNPYIKAVLTYRAYELYGDLPGQPTPVKPANYKQLQWRNWYE